MACRPEAVVPDDGLRSAHAVRPSGNRSRGCKKTRSPWPRERISRDVCPAVHRGWWCRIFRNPRRTRLSARLLPHGCPDPGLKGPLFLIDRCARRGRAPWRVRRDSLAISAVARPRANGTGSRLTRGAVQCRVCVPRAWQASAILLTIGILLSGTVAGQLPDEIENRQSIRAECIPCAAPAGTPPALRGSTHVSTIP